MKKIFVLTVLASVCIMSCATPTIEEETSNLELNEIIAVDRDEIERPGDQSGS